MEAWPDTDFMQVYGLTEVAGVITHLMPPEHRDADHPERLVSAGRCIPGAELKVVDPVTLEERRTGEHGELWFRTPQLMKGFLNKPSETAQVITDDGWFRTGDLGKVDADGYVYVEDRLKDMIISGGENIYPAEVEDVLYRHPAIAECAVIGVPDQHWGEVGRAVVVLRDGAGAEPAELLDFLTGKIARYKIPKSVVFVTSLPRSGSGKILKGPLRRAHTPG
jgi:acyl-CoA synthetase (AMP-forming)/AMP-acid ligase II